MPQYIFWALPFLLYLVLKGMFSKKIFIIISTIPLLQVINPLYNISPVIIWDENNYPPWSDIFIQLQYIFSTPANLVPYIFSIILLISLIKIVLFPKVPSKIEKIYISGEYEWNTEEPDQLTRQRIELIVKVIKNIKPRKILDVGCGSGLALQKLDGIVKVGVDLSTLALNKIKNENIDRICADAQHLPLKNNVFDTIICGDILEHIPNLNLAVFEIKRVMMSKAYLVVTLPYLIEVINYIYNLITGKGYLNIQHIHRHTLRGWRNIFERNGFQIVKASPILNLKYLIYILIKKEKL
jgi:SAM-dependent methyltransferase